MSDKISYILEVLDGYSKNTRKLKKELGTLESSLSSLDKKLNSTLVKFTKFEKLNFASTVSQFEKMAKSMDKVSVANARAKKASSGFILVGNGSQITAVSAAEIRRQRSLRNAVVPFSNPFIMMGGAMGGAYNPRRYRPNFSIPIDSTYRKDAAGTGIVPYSRGGSIMPFGQRPMIDVTGTGRTIDQNPTLPSQPQPQQPSKRGGFFAGGDGVSFTNVAKGMGYYRAIDMAVSAPSRLHDVTLQMESLTNTFDALIPKTKGYEGETAQSQIQYLRELSKQLGVKFADIADPYRKMMATGVGDKQLFQQLVESVGGYSRLVGMDSGAFKGTMLAFEQMLTKQKVQAQEFNLQTQQMPGVKPIFYEAFRRIMEKKGVKLSEKEAAPAFLKYMEAGALDSAVLLREFSKVVKEDFWVDVMKKAQSTQAQENRLSNAFYNLAADIGTYLNPTLNKTVVGLTEMIEGIGQFNRDLQAVFEVPILKQFKDFFLKPVLEGIGLIPAFIADLFRAIVQGTMFGLEMLITGDNTNFNKLSDELRLKWFGIEPEKTNPFNNQFTPIPTSPQEVLVKIVGENLPTGISIKQESYGMTPRPRTVIAGGL